MSVINTTADVKVEQQIGQRLMLSFDCVKPYVHKQADGTEINAQRVYHLAVPYMSPFEEIYTVIDELKVEVLKQEQLSKENAAKIAAENAAKEKEVAVDEAATN